MNKRVRKVATHIQKVVKRPKKLPRFSLYAGALRWPKNRCPMGLLPEAKREWGSPSSLDDFKAKPDDFTEGDVGAFADWWDSQDDPEKAVDAVWGPEKKSVNKKKTSKPTKKERK